MKCLLKSLFLVLLVFLPHASFANAQLHEYVNRLKQEFERDNSALLAQGVPPLRMNSSRLVKETVEWLSNSRLSASQEQRLRTVLADEWKKDSENWLLAGVMFLMFAKQDASGELREKIFGVIDNTMPKDSAVMDMVRELRTTQPRESAAPPSSSASAAPPALPAISPPSGHIGGPVDHYNHELAEDVRSSVKFSRPSDWQRQMHGEQAHYYPGDANPERCSIVLSKPEYILDGVHHLKRFESFFRQVVTQPGVRLLRAGPVNEDFSKSSTRWLMQGAEVQRGTTAESWLVYMGERWGIWQTAMYRCADPAMNQREARKAMLALSELAVDLADEPARGGGESGSDPFGYCMATCRASAGFLYGDMVYNACRASCYRNHSPVKPR